MVLCHGSSSKLMHIGTNITKHPDINLRKYVHDIYTENFKTLVRGVKKPHTNGEMHYTHELKTQYCNVNSPQIHL